MRVRRLPINTVGLLPDLLTRVVFDIQQLKRNTTHLSGLGLAKPTLQVELINTISTSHTPN